MRTDAAPPRLPDPQDHEGRLGLVSGLTIAISALIVALLFLVLTAVPFRIFLFSVLILVGVLGLVILRNSKQFLLALLVAGTGIGLDFHFVYQYSPQFHSTNGYFLHIIFFPLFVLLLRRIWLTFQGEERFSLRRKGLIPLTLFVIFAAMSGNFAPMPAYTAFELFALAQCLLIYLLLSEDIRGRQDLFTLCVAIAGMVALQGLLAGMQYATGSSLGLDFLGETKRLAWEAFSGEGLVRRASGTLGYPNSLALYLDLLLPMVFGLALIARKPLLKGLLWGATLLGMLGMLASVSRGGILATVFTIFAVTLYAGARKRQFTRHLVVFVLIVALIVGALLITDTPLRTRLFQSGDSSAQSRLPMMDVATRMIASNALTGVGLNNYTTVAPGYDFTLTRISLQFPFPVHNIFLLILTEIGVFGFMALALFIIWILFKGLRLSADANPDIGVIAFGLTMGLIGYFLHGLVDFDYITANFTLWIVLGSITGLAHMRRSASESGLPESV